MREQEEALARFVWPDRYIYFERAFTNREMTENGLFIFVRKKGKPDIFVRAFSESTDTCFEYLAPKLNSFIIDAQSQREDYIRVSVEYNDLTAQAFGRNVAETLSSAVWSLLQRSNDAKV